MLAVLFLHPLLLKVAAMPVAFGATTTSTVVYTALSERQPDCDCTGMMQRTLFDIVRSCLLTIAACVYRAVHQNIPDPKATWGKRLWIRIKITALALLAPETMIWWGMKQWMGAKIIRDAVNGAEPTLEWSLTHGHFLQMGGIVRKDNGRVLRLSDLLLHLRDGQIDIEVFRKISTKEIQDHSKGDLLSKTLVTVQTTWFILECITRWQQRLLLTELEVVTLAFAVLNIITYGFWWHKPLDVLCPIQLDIRERPLPTSPAGVEASPANDDLEDAAEDRDLIPIPSQKSPAMPPKAPTAAHAILSTLESAWGVVSSAFGGWREDIVDAFEADGWMKALAAAMFTPFVAVVDRLEELFEKDELDDPEEHATHVPIFYAVRIPLQERWTMVLYLSCFIGMIFGAIHFLPWNSTFPKRTESLLWRISSVILVVEPLLVIVITFLVNLWDSAEDGILYDAMIAFGILSGFFTTVGFIAYLVARFCLLALAFLTLRNLPSDVFETVSWTSYIPHL